MRRAGPLLGGIVGVSRRVLVVPRQQARCLCFCQSRFQKDEHSQGDWGRLRLSMRSTARPTVGACVATNIAPYIPTRAIVPYIIRKPKHDIGTHSGVYVTR